jgi:hypothetical protein
VEPLQQWGTGSEGAECMKRPRRNHSAALKANVAIAAAKGDLVLMRSLDGQTPDHVCFTALPQVADA